ncbi:oligosaccharide flippase family protein [Aequorivita antarctica]|uniref:oligosaccharide flippase family protein n=1 Tax=Aequorivita antarctica TaxID=153266 RepID=UPI001F44BEF0|nr:oligosaccharide flippase family protein [Aequorivita antarctica]
MKKYFNILKGKDAKVLLENFFSLSALQLVGMLLPLITLPYLLRVLGFSNYGIVILAGSLIAYFQSITDYSFKITATRDVAVFRNSPEKMNIIYSKVLMIKGMFLCLSFLALFAIVMLYPPFYEERKVFFLTMPLLLGYSLFPEWFFQGIEKMKYISLLNIGIKLFFTICVFIFITKKEDYWIYPLLQSAGFIGAGLVGQYILIKKYKLKFRWLRFKMIKNTIKDNFPIFINQFLPNLYNNTNTLLLGIFTTTYLVGIYDALKKIIDLCVALLNVVSRVFFPFLNRRKDAFPKYRNMMLVLGLVLAMMPIIVNPLVFWYLDMVYENALLILTLLSLSIIGYTAYDIFGLNYFIIRRKDKLVMKNTIVSSLIGFVLAFPLIYFFNILGAAINLMFARFMMGGGLTWNYFKSKK